MPTVMTLSSDVELGPAFVHAFHTGTLTEQQAQAFAEQDPLIIKFLLLQLSAAPATPHPPRRTCLPSSR